MLHSQTLSLSKLTPVSNKSQILWPDQSLVLNLRILKTATLVQLPVMDGARFVACVEGFKIGNAEAIIQILLSYLVGRIGGAQIENRWRGINIDFIYRLH